MDSRRSVLVVSLHWLFVDAYSETLFLPFTITNSTTLTNTSTSSNPNHNTSLSAFTAWGCLANHNGQRSFTLSLNWMCLNLLQISSIEVEQHGYPLNLLQILTTITNLPTLRNKTSIMCVHRPLVVTALFPTQIYDTSFSYPTLSHTPCLTPTLSLGIGAHCVWPGFLAEIMLSDKEDWLRRGELLEFKKPIFGV